MIMQSLWQHLNGDPLYCHNLSGRSLVCSSVRSFWAPCSHAHINFFLGAVSHALSGRGVTCSYALSGRKGAWILTSYVRVDSLWAQMDPIMQFECIRNLINNLTSHPYDLTTFFLHDVARLSLFFANRNTEVRPISKKINYSSLKLNILNHFGISSAILEKAIL